MDCPACSAANRSDAQYCLHCGGKLQRECAACGHVLPPGARFCDQCGTAVGAGHAPSASAEADGGPRGERRHLTVLFCDVVDSTPLSQRLDAEEYSALLQEYQTSCAEAIAEFDGSVAQYLGDGIVAYFGYPTAHENAAERAVRAGLAIVDHAKRKGAEWEEAWGERLDLRIGVHSGSVVVTEMGAGQRKETLASGDVMNLAARLQGAAQANSVVVSEATLRLTRGVFAAHDLGEQELKGFEDPVRAFAVVTAAGNRDATEAVRPTTPLIGRQQELGLLDDRWEQSQEGRGQVVLVSGDAGIGKSRLIREWRDRLSQASYVWFETKCTPFTQRTAFQPSMDLVGAGVGFRETDTAAQRLEKLQAGLRVSGMGSDEDLSVLGTFLDLPLPPNCAKPDLNPEALKRRTIDVLAEWMIRVSTLQPVVVIVEDAHWIDQGSVEVFTALVEQIPTAQMMLVGTHRPEISFDLPNRAHVTPISLNRLTRAQSAELLQTLVADTPMDEARVTEVLQRTDGVPLYLEEFATSLRQDDGTTPADRTVPVSLQDSLMARLDHLGPAKDIAQLASVIGREFSESLLKAMSSAPDADVEASLRQLVAADILYPKRSGDEVGYVFKHALIQDTAYESLLRATRREYHGRAADAAVTAASESGSAQPATIAHHLTQAGRDPEAVAYWHRAGELAEQRSADEEALRHLEQALELLHRAPESAQRNLQEIGVLSVLLRAQISALGYGAPETEASLNRCYTLWEQIGEPDDLFTVLDALFTLQQTLGHRDTAGKIAWRQLQIAERTGNAWQLAHAARSSAIMALHDGAHEQCTEWGRRALAAWAEGGETGWAQVGGDDIEVNIRSWQAWNLWILGYPDQSLTEARAARDRAKRLGKSYTFANASAFEIQVHAWRQEWDQVLIGGEQLALLSAEHHYPLWLNASKVAMGNAMARTGNADRGIALLQEALRGFHRLRLDVEMGPFRISYAWALFCGGRLVEALAEAKIAHEYTLSRGLEKYYEPEVQRMYAEILYANDPSRHDEVERLLIESLQVARERKAMGWQLRAAASLARFHGANGRTAQACSVLGPIYEWFTEGLDTPELEEAKQVLDDYS